MNIHQFSQKYSATANDLYGFAFFLTRDKTNADDLVQDTAFRALKNLEKFRPGSNFKAWITTIMRNTFINSIRKRQRSKLDFKDSTEFNYINTNQTLEESTVEQKLIQDDIENLLYNIDNTWKDAFILRYKGYSYQEISQMLKIPLGTAKGQVFKGRQELKKRIKQFRLHSS